MIQKLLAISGVGMAIVPELAVKEYVKSGELKVIGSLQNTYSELFFITASRKVENPLAAKVVKEFSF